MHIKLKVQNYLLPQQKKVIKSGFIKSGNLKIDTIFTTFRVKCVPLLRNLLETVQNSYYCWYRSLFLFAIPSCYFIKSGFFISTITRLVLVSVSVGFFLAARVLATSVPSVTWLLGCLATHQLQLLVVVLQSFPFCHS